MWDFWAFDNLSAIRSIILHTITAVTCLVWLLGIVGVWWDFWSLNTLLTVAVLVISQRFKPKKEVGEHGQRLFSGPEHNFRCIIETNGVINITFAIKAKEQLNASSMRKAIDKFQQEYVFLRTYVRRESSWRYEVPPGDVKTIPLVVLWRAPDETPGAECWRQLLDDEVQRPFEEDDLPMRITLIQSLDSPTEMILTLNHVFADGKSSGTIGAKLLILYEDFEAKRLSDLAESSDDEQLSSEGPSKEPVSPISVIRRKAPRRGVPISPAGDILRPKYFPSPLLAFIGFLRLAWLTRFFTLSPIKIPVSPAARENYTKPTPRPLAQTCSESDPTSNSPPRSLPLTPSRAPLLWRSANKEMRLSVEETTALIASCKSRRTTVTSTMYSAAAYATIDLVSSVSDSINRLIYAFIMVDMRGYAIAKGNFDLAFSIGNYIGALEFVHEVPSVDKFWDYSKTVRSDTYTSLGNGLIFSAMEFNGYCTKFASIFAKRFRHPPIAPAFIISNLGNIGGAGQMPTEIPKDGHKAMLSDLMSQMSLMDDMSCAISMPVSWPFFQITTATFNDQLRVWLGYCPDSVCEPWINQFNERFLYYLKKAAQDPLPQPIEADRTKPCLPVVPPQIKGNATMISVA